MAVSTAEGTSAPSLPLGSWIFSADDHLLESTETFVGRVPRRFADDAPRIVDHEGGDAWLVEGAPVAIGLGDGTGTWEIGDRPLLRIRGKNAPTMGSGYSRGGPTADPARDALPRSAKERLDRGLVRVREDFRPGVYDPHARVLDMDRDGVWASVLIPSITFGFAGQRFSLWHDLDAGLAFARAYNDWLAEDVAGAYPERFVCSQIPWLADPVVGAQLIRANAARGFTATLFPENPERFGFPSIHTRHWDPFLAACEETGTVLNIHLGTGLQAFQPSSDSPLPVAKGALAVNSSLSAFDWVFSGIPTRFAGIKASFTEGGIDFVPLVYGRLDTMWQDSLDGYWDDDELPADVLVRNFWFSALFDIGAYHFLAERCPDHVMIETDYPHGDTVWPHSQEHFAGRLRGLSPEIREKFLITNAVDLYRHPIPNRPIPNRPIPNRPLT